MIAARGPGRPDVATVQKILESVKHLEANERVERLEQELRAKLVERQLLLMESLSFRYAGGYGFGVEDPVSDDGEPWDEIGIGGVISYRSSLPQLRTLEDLRRSRDLGRWLACENEYAIGAHDTRKRYLVGKGLKWRAVPKEIADEDKALTRKVADVIKRFREQEGWVQTEAESVLRADRDGEYFAHLYPNANGPPRVRFDEPEHVLPPAGGDLGDQVQRGWGVEVVGGDPVAYWIVGDGLSPYPSRVPAIYEGLDVREDGPGIPAIVHHKLNVDRNVRRGWPTMWPIRQNLARAEKLLRNMSWVAACQAAIALIKRYENATQSQVQALIDGQAEVSATSSLTGRRQDFVGARPGQIWHAPKGTTYEAPIASVDAERNIAVLQADLRAAAARMGMPEYMFTGDSSNAAYASQLVAESPFVKAVEADQVLFGTPLFTIMQAVLIHEEFMGRLPRGTFGRYDLQVEFPNPIVRDQLQEAQRKQILMAKGVVSRLTVRAQEGLDDVTEERNLDAEKARGYGDLRVGEDPMAGDPGKPPPGSTDGGPGGVDQKPGEPGKPGRPPEAGGPAPSGQDPAAGGAPPASGPAPAAPAGGADAVQDTALNGAQVQAMQQVIMAVAGKQIPPAAAIEMLVVAFPTIGRERAATMVNAAASFEQEKPPAPSSPPPPPAAGQPERGEAEEDPEEDQTT